MATYSLTTGSGVVLLSTEWSQHGKVSGSEIRYNEYCPTDPVSSEKCVTGCTNTAAAQILYYWLENSDFTLQLQLTQEDSYTSQYRQNRTITIDATAATAQQNGYLSFSKVNQALKSFTVGDASDIAALCFACGVVQQADYSSSSTSTAWDKDLFLRSGMAGCTVLSSSSNDYFYESGETISDAVFEVLIAELLAGRPVGTSYPGHALIFDGYDKTADKFHINYGWGGYLNGWYTRQEICDEGFYEFYLDIIPDYDGTPITVTSAADYGVGTLIRSMEQLKGITKADTLTIETGSIQLTLKNRWYFEKAITINNLNADINSSGGIIYNTGSLTVSGLSGNIEDTGSSAAFYAKENLAISNFSGTISSATAFSAGKDIKISEFSGTLTASSTAIYAKGNIEITGFDGTIFSSSSGLYSPEGNVTVTKFTGTVIATSYGFYSSGNITVTGFSGTITASSTAIYAKGNIEITGFDGTVSSSSSGLYSYEGNVTVTEFTGTIRGASSGIRASGNLTFSNGTGSIIAESGKYMYAFSGNSVSLQNFSGICIAAGTAYSCAVQSNEGKLELSANGGRIFAGAYTSQKSVDTLVQDLSVYGAAGVDKAIQHDTECASKYAVSGDSSDDTVLLKNYSTAQGSISLDEGNDSLSVLGGSYVYAPSVNKVETVNIDSTSTVSIGTVYGSAADCMTVNMTITAETPSEELIRYQGYFYNFYNALKNKTLNIDLRAAVDGEYVLINAAGAQYADNYLPKLSAQFNNGSGNTTLKCGESGNHISLKYENEKLILVLDGFAESKAEALLFDGEQLLSVNKSVSSRTLSAAGTDSLRLTNGGTANYTTVNAGGDLSVSNSGTATGTVVNANGFLAVNSSGCAINTTVKADGIVNLGTGAVHTGSLVIEEGGKVFAENSATIDFTLSGFSASTYKGISDFSRITGTPQYTLSVSNTQSSGKYVLAGNAAEFNSTITVSGLGKTGSVSLGKAFSYNGKKYSLAISETNQLQLYISQDSEDVDPPAIQLTGDNTTLCCESTLSASTEAGVTIYYSTDNASWQKYTAPIAVKSNGTYYFKATDAAGNTGYAQRTFSNIDGEAPDVPKNIEIAIDSTSVSLKWQTCLDHGIAGLSGYTIAYRCGSGAWVTQDVETNSFSLDDLPAGDYQLKIRAYDALGNTSEYSEVQSFQVAGGYKRIVTSSGTVEIGDSALFAGHTGSYGGAVYNKGSMTIGNAAVFSGNSASGGGAVYNYGGSMTIGNSAAFSGNSADYGGAVYNNSGSMAIGNSAIFSGNSAGGDGGAVDNYNGSIFIENSAVFSGNSADDGGAVYNYGGSMSIGNSAIFSGNSAELYGGAVYNAGSMNIGNLAEFTKNTANYGGAILNKGNMTFSSAAFSGNTAELYGGAIYNIGGSMTLSSASFSGNFAKGSLCNQGGGAIYHNKGDLTLSSVLFTGNSAILNGGAIKNDSGNVLLTSAFFSGNIASHLGGVLCNHESMTVSSAVFVGNSAVGGGVIYNTDRLTFRNSVVFSGNTAGSYGGVVCNRGTMILDSAEFTGNSAGISGGAIDNGTSGNIILNSANFSGNLVKKQGGAVDNGGNMTLSSATFSGNSAGSNGGAVYNGGSMTIGCGVVFSGNSAGGNGGGAIYNGGSMTIGRVAVFSGNSAGGNGGAVCNYRSANVTLEASAAFSGNNAANWGGAIYNNGNMIISSGVVFSGNTAGSSGGGAIYNGGSMTIGRAAVFSGNSAGGNGGAVYNYRSANVTLEASAVFSGNNAANWGGAIYNNGNMIISSGVVFSGNTAGSNGGGAIYNGGSMTIGSSAIFTGNSAGGNGGAVYNSSGLVTLTSAAFSGNSAGSYGGAVYNYYGSMTLSSAVFSGNSAGNSGGAIYNGTSGTLNLTNARFETQSDTIYNAGTMTLAGTITLAGSLYTTKTITATGAKIVWDLSSYASGNTKELISDMSKISGAASWAVTVNASQAAGNYILAANASTFAGSVTIRNSDNTYLGTLSVGKQFTSGNYTYALNRSSSSGLSLDISTNLTPITIIANSSNKTYNGTALKASGYTYVGKLQTGDTLNVSVTGSQTDAGSSASTISACKIMRGTLDVTSDYDVTCVAGTLTVKQRNITLASGSGTKEYDGTPLTDNTITVSGNGFVTGEGYTATVTGSQLEVGSSENTFTYTLNSGTKAENYKITTKYGTLEVTPAAVPLDLAGDSCGISWNGSAESYTAAYSKDNYAHSLQIDTVRRALDTYGMSGSYAWHVRNSDSESWVQGEGITAAHAETPQELVSDADGNGDLFFGTASDVWSGLYQAQHLGVDSWAGTRERVSLAGKNKITDVFSGSTDANILVLTDDSNGDALFLDDIYSAFPTEQKARLAQIDEIRAGAGNDVVDLTSQRFDYTNGMLLRGGDGNDTLWANKGENKLFGDSGNDRLVGCFNNDVLVGGIGNDSMHGGGGNDIFCFCNGWGNDTVEQIANGTVTLWFESQTGTWDQSTMTYSDGTNSVKVSGVSTVTLKYGDDGSEQYDELAAAGAFMEASSFNIFEEKNKGIIAYIE